MQSQKHVGPDPSPMPRSSSNSSRSSSGSSAGNNAVAAAKPRSGEEPNSLNGGGDKSSSIIIATGFLVACAVYLYLAYALSLYPGVVGGDSGELLAAACSGSVARKSTIHLCPCNGFFL